MIEFHFNFFYPLIYRSFIISGHPELVEGDRVILREPQYNPTVS